MEVPDKRATEKTSQALREGLDVRHKTYRPEKMARRDSDSSSENPRKRTRAVHGKVLGSPRIDGKKVYVDASIPELAPEGSLAQRKNIMQSLGMFFEPPKITKADCDDTAAV